MEAREVVGGANVSQITTLALLELYPVAAITDPLEVMYVTSLQVNIILITMLKHG